MAGTALHFAATHGRGSTVWLLLSRQGAQVSRRAENGMPPLFLASSGGHAHQSRIQHGR
jgi:hypothetical protein